MADSVDRVFSHALSVGNKIRTGSEKPPAATRLKLYGLYKQSMEGDVDGIMDRPEGGSDEAQRAQENWDAWKEQTGLSRTEAKRRYISTVIDTMHKYASPSPDVRELISELEFVWDQVKSNVPSSSSSSPLRTLSGPTGLGNLSNNTDAAGDDYRATTVASSRPVSGAQAPIRVLSPVTQADEDDLDDNVEFVDAPDSKYDEGAELSDREAHQSHSPTPITRKRSNNNPSERPEIGAGVAKGGGGGGSGGVVASSERVADQRWRRRVEQALVNMTTEVAALREQLEARRLFAYSKRRRVARFVLRLLWAAAKHIAVDMVLLALVLLYLRRRHDTRLEGAVRVLLGDAVAQVQKVGGAQIAHLNLGKVKLPKIPGQKGVGGGG
ncbi:acyl CoA binding protein-domain-containing protein [Lineolata rhizophorae]|uniref:Acyl CoA binding protein-domain-containing protein n=1 Tax=Lineolata rhizophorae TaxID=578093 RepID=A0A6A6PEI2_9PEZI|nr:acyl CoA binding protein-domain-containing protein [Lineolata rhizophorae]